MIDVTMRVDGSLDLLLEEDGVKTLRGMREIMKLRDKGE